MIGWGDIYKVVQAMVPLYFALSLGYGSVRWWRIFTPQQSDAINRLVAFFALPFFTFHFTLTVNPFTMNFRFLAADSLSKILIVVILFLYARFSRRTNDGAADGDKDRYCWAITGFSLLTLTNSLVVGAPLLEAMYGRWAEELVVQTSVVQGIVWLTLLLFVFEVRKAAAEGEEVAGGGGEKEGVVVVAVATEEGKDVEEEEEEELRPSRPTFWMLMKIVWIKLALNPNTYASVLGVSWAFIANRWHFQMPVIMDNSVLIMAKSGTGMAMFSMGLFMAQQKKIIACGPGLTAIGMALRFVAGPAAMAVGSIAVGLRGDVLRVAIIQAAVPQSITSFIFAKEYGLHADVLSTAVIFGMLVSLPILVVYYILLEFMH